MIQECGLSLAQSNHPGMVIDRKTILSDPGTEQGLLSCSGRDEFERLCDLDILELQGIDNNQSAFHKYFMDGLKRLDK